MSSRNYSRCVPANTSICPSWRVALFALPPPPPPPPPPFPPSPPPLAKTKYGQNRAQSTHDDQHENDGLSAESHSTHEQPSRHWHDADEDRGNGCAKDSHQNLSLPHLLCLPCSLSCLVTGQNGTGSRRAGRTTEKRKEKAVGIEIPLPAPR